VSGAGCPGRGPAPGHAMPTTQVNAGTVIIHGIKISDRSPRAGREDCALWGVTRANCRFWKGKLLDWTEWYDVHPLVASSQFPGIPERRPDAWKWYCAQDGTRPIYLQAPEAHAPSLRAEALRRFNMVPGAVRFPIRDIQQRFPINGEPNRWFVEMAGMLIAKALFNGYNKIILNGIGTQTTYEFERAHRSILYWIGHARGMGVHVEVEGKSIFHTPRSIYAYEKFNYDELDQARLDTKIAIEKVDYAGLQAINDRERARGRPIKHRIPAWE
jgi:hypothetical protein